MRVRITFKVSNRGAVIPFHHQPIIAQLLKGLMLGSGFESFTHFSFSGLKGQTNVGREGLYVVSSRVTVVISSQDQNFIDFLVTKLFNQEEIGIAALKITPESVDIEQEPQLDKASRFVCISPILLLAPKFNSDSAKQFIMPDLDEFSDLLYESVIHRMGEVGIDSSKIEGIQKFQLIPDLDYLKKLKDSNKKFSRIYSFYDQDVMYESRGYTFPFTLYAVKEVLEFAYVHGLGFYNHKGFGMIDTASDVLKNTSVYEVNRALKTA